MLKTSYIPWNDDVIYVLDHHAKLNFHTANSPEQQSVGKLVTPRALGHIILLRTNKSLLLLLNAVSNKYQYCTTDVVHTHTHTHIHLKGKPKTFLPPSIGVEPTPIYDILDFDTLHYQLLSLCQDIISVTSLSTVVKVYSCKK